MFFTSCFHNLTVLIFVYRLSIVNNKKKRGIMKKLMILAFCAAMTFAFAGCKKEETPGSKLDSAIQQSKTTADAATADASKKADEAAAAAKDALKK